MGDEMHCGTCRHLATDGVECEVRGKGRPAPGDRCCGWELLEVSAQRQRLSRDLPSPTTSAFISGLINELHDRVSKKAFGRVGLTFVIHEGMVSKYEWTDSTTVKPENGKGGT